MSNLTSYFFHLGEILLKSPEDIQSNLLTAVHPTLVDKDSIKFSKQINGSILDAAIDDILQLSIATEVKGISQKQFHDFQFTANDLDLEFKKSLILFSIHFVQLPGISKNYTPFKMLLHSRLIEISQFHANKKNYDILLQCMRALAAARMDETGYILNNLTKVDVVHFVGGIPYSAEVAPFSTKVVSLGLLADLMAEGKCIPHLLLWKGNVAHGRRGLSQNQVIQELQNYNKYKQKNWLLPMLMSTWRLEEEKIQVLRQPNGVIKDIQAPLMGRDHRQWLTSRKKQVGDSFSIAELCGSGRSKIYCIISLLKFHCSSIKAVKHMPTFEDYTNALDADDQTTLKLVENYPFLKKGEKWLETKVIGPMDDETMEILCNRSIGWAETVFKEQEELQMKGTRTVTIK
ncbi:hypothetical protein J437_LFUL015241 [Ladona fulva]|uniref:Cilia- and flagella-associated protein 69 ARM repeats domain-containing protein n=1 Tax=Ladona fulva TaxID=123851 RepID=A0A8K0P5Q7_LADFU|nr:hypothetical protein J437_LFUL015241 [Ladona fulva]